MQSPQKLRARLDDLLGPPGPDGDPLELVLRTVVQTTAPMVEGVIAQYTAEQLDQGLEGVALYFLGIRSDDRELSSEFLTALGKINVEAIQAAHTVDSTAAAEELPAGDPTPGSAPVTSPSSSSAPDSSSSESSPTPSADPSSAPASGSSGSADPAPAPANPQPPWGNA